MRYKVIEIVPHAHQVLPDRIRCKILSAEAVEHIFIPNFKPDSTIFKGVDFEYFPGKKNHRRTDIYIREDHTHFNIDFLLDINRPLWILGNGFKRVLLKQIGYNIA